MSMWERFRKWLSQRRRADEVRADLDEERQTLIDARIDYLVERGLSAEDARAEALRRQGSMTLEAGSGRPGRAITGEMPMSPRPFLDQPLKDLTYATRVLLHHRAFTMVVVATLALGLGAMAVVFCAVDALMWRPLPFRSPGALMFVKVSVDGDELPWSYPKFLSFQRAQDVFGSLSLYHRGQLNVTEGEPERILGEWVSASYLSTLGLTPSAGRDLARGPDGQPDAAREILISDAFWRRRFGADRAVVGTTLELDRVSYDVVGIAPPGFGGLTGETDVFAPIASKNAAALNHPQLHEYSLVVRRRADVTVEQAQAAVTALGASIAAEFPSGTKRWGAVARPLDEVRTSPIARRSLLILLGAGACVLLIACVNLAALSLGRTGARQRESTIRLALGASPRRIAALFLTESLLLSILGGAAGLLLAWGILRVADLNPLAVLGLPMSAELNVARLSSIRLDSVAIAVTIGMALLVGAFFGALPALKATKGSLVTAASLRGADASHVRRPGRLPSHRLLIVVEVAVAMVLLAAAGVMIRSVAELVSIDPGFEASHVLTLRLNLPSGAMPQDAVPVFASQMLDRLGALPGVSAAGISDCQPLGERCSGTRATFPDRPAGSVPRPEIGVRWVTADWFSALRIPLKRGRVFDAGDRRGAPSVVVVNETAAAQFWPKEDAVGKHMGMGQGGPGDIAEVVGVVGDVRGSIEAAPVAETYLAFNQAPRSNMIIFLRTSGDPGALAGPARLVIREVAPRYPQFDVQTMSARIARATARSRQSAVSLAALAAMALALTLVGVYGVVSFMVTQRTREIGIRLALGATRHDIFQLVMRESLGLTAIGVASGLLGAFWLSSLLKSLVFDVRPSDPIVFGATAMLLGVAAALASWIPARRAVRIDPAGTLRAE